MVLRGFCAFTASLPLGVLVSQQYQTRKVRTICSQSQVDDILYRTVYPLGVVLRPTVRVWMATMNDDLLSDSTLPSDAWGLLR